MRKPSKTAKKAVGSLAGAVLLFTMLVMTTFALALPPVSVDGNLFETARVKIELNGGQTIFDGSDMNIQPGHSLVRDFTVENKGSAEVHIRLYLENVDSSLGEALLFEIYDGDKRLFSGKADELSKTSPCRSDTPLAVGETRTLTAVVNMRENAGNTCQSGSAAFDITADAVQARNNPDMSFE